ncbi:MAG: hypothetical protein F9K29_10795 [Hyphomicrobiaceae bacterium]|nr:MAG: hypothetical protein F9K29_10795 [Hyphomicrobiaceae bacterium]
MPVGKRRPREEQSVVSAAAQALAVEAIAAADTAKAELSRIAGLDTGQAPGTGAPMSVAQIAARAKAELSTITGLDVDHVSSIVNASDGWHVTVDLIELKRIPAATDVLAAYEAVFAPGGSLLSYHRRRRYFRDQMLDEQ